MLSTLISALVFAVPIVIFLALQFMAQANRRRGHWPQPKPPPEPAGATPRKRTRARARVRPVGGEPSCDRNLTHALLTLVGARDSCRSCAELRKAAPAAPVDFLAEAERIVKEAQE